MSQDIERVVIDFENGNTLVLGKGQISVVSLEHEWGNPTIKVSLEFFVTADLWPRPEQDQKSLPERKALKAPEPRANDEQVVP